MNCSGPALLGALVPPCTGDALHVVTYRDEGEPVLSDEGVWVHPDYGVPMCAGCTRWALYASAFANDHGSRFAVWGLEDL